MYSDAFFNRLIVAVDGIWILWLIVVSRVLWSHEQTLTLEKFQRAVRLFAYMVSSGILTAWFLGIFASPDTESPPVVRHVKELCQLVWTFLSGAFLGLVLHLMKYQRTR